MKFLLVPILLPTNTAFFLIKIPPSNKTFNILNKNYAYLRLSKKFYLSNKNLTHFFKLILQ